MGFLLTVKLGTFVLNWCRPTTLYATIFCSGVIILLLLSAILRLIQAYDRSEMTGVFVG